MLTLQVIACIGIITGAFLLFQIGLNDFTGNIFHRLLDAPKGIREEILEETKRRKKSYFRREIEEVQAILKTTDREELFPLFVPHDFIDPFHFLPHFCARFLRITSLCQVRADTNLAIEKFYFSIFLLPALLSEQCPHGLYDLIADDGKIGCKET